MLYETIRNDYLNSNVRWHPFTSNLSHVESRFATVGNIMDGTILQEPQAL